MYQLTQVELILEYLQNTLPLSKYISELDTRIRGYAVKKSSFFSKYISDLDTRIRGYVVRKSCFFSNCISELDTETRIRSVEVVFLIEVYL